MVIVAVPLPEVELIVLGDVQGVGYRQYVTKIGRRLKLEGFVENLNDGTVRIHCKGNEKDISEFKKQINMKTPEAAPLIDVEDIKERQLDPETIKQTFFEEVYGDERAEMSQGFSTGMKYMILFNGETQANLNLFRTETNANFKSMDANFKGMDENLNHFRTETNANFKSMDDKYHLISENMIAIVARLEESNKTFESRIEKTEKNIESLLKILASK